MKKTKVAIKHFLKTSLKSFSRHIGFEIIENSEFKKISQESNSFQRMERWSGFDGLSKNKKSILLDLIHESNSQLGQDILVAALNGINPGYFVEFGATDGISGSNTKILEEKFGWKGICVEPALMFHRSLKINRTCSLDFRCVSSTSKEVVTFSEGGFLSTISSFEKSDSLFPDRGIKRRYQVETISLDDLLVQHSAPFQIDFMSIDTEGSEYEILSTFSFDKYNVLFFCIEHNYSSNQIKIDQLLKSKGYTCIFPDFSLFDGWYVKKEAFPDLIL